jgi:hypothetical protein
VLVVTRDIFIVVSMETYVCEWQCVCGLCKRERERVNECKGVRENVLHILADTTVLLLKFGPFNYSAPFTEWSKIVSNFRQRSSCIYIINGNRMHTQMDCGILTSKNSAKLK